MDTPNLTFMCQLFSLQLHPGMARLLRIVRLFRLVKIASRQVESKAEQVFSQVFGLKGQTTLRTGPIHHRSPARRGFTGYELSQRIGHFCFTQNSVFHSILHFYIVFRDFAWRLWCVIEISWLPARPSHPGFPGPHHGYGGSTYGGHGLWCNSLCWAFPRQCWWSAHHDRCDHWEPKTIGHLPLGSDRAKGACCARAWFWGTSWPLFSCGKLLCKTRTGAAPVECFLQTHSEIRSAFSILWPLLPWSIFTPQSQWEHVQHSNTWKQADFKESLFAPVHVSMCLNDWQSFWVESNAGYEVRGMDHVCHGHSEGFRHAYGLLELEVLLESWTQYILQEIVSLQGDWTNTDDWWLYNDEWWMIRRGCVRRSCQF